MHEKRNSLFFSALMFYTRIPCPKWVDHSDENLNKSRKYFPLIGWIVGTISALSVFLLHQILPLSVGILLSIAISIYITGAFHEDGFADTCDGFGGGWTKEQILTIMKDSRIGTYGTVGILLILSIKFSILYEIGTFSLPLLFASYINGHITSRFVASTLIQTHEYVQDIDKSKSRPITSTRLSPGEMIFGFLFVGIGWLLFAPNFILSTAFISAHLSKIYLGHYFKKHIGGYTGDCLGATQQIGEVVFLMTVLTLCKFIEPDIQHFIPG